MHVPNWSPFLTSRHTPFPPPSNIDLTGSSISSLPYQNINFIAGLMSLDMDDLWLFDTGGKGGGDHICWHFYNKKHSTPKLSDFIMERRFFYKTGTSILLTHHKLPQ